MPEPRNLYIDKTLTRFSVQYSNEDYIWRFLMPEVKVDERSGLYYIYDKDDVYRNVDDSVTPIGMPNEIDWKVSTDNYSVRDRALSDWLPQEAIDAADAPLKPQKDTNDYLNGKLDLAHEVRVANLAFSPATYPVGNKVTLAGTDQWGGSTDDPIQDIQTAIDACFVRANTLTFGFEAWNIFRRLPEVLDAVKGATRFQASPGAPGGLANRQDVANLFEVDRVLVGRGRIITSKEGQPSTYGRIWGKHMAATHVTPGELGVKTPTFGKTFVEAKRRTFRDFDGKRGVKGAHYLKVSWNEVVKVVASDLGYLITDAVP